MTLLFLPIDIDIDISSFSQEDSASRLTAYNPYWASASISTTDIERNNFDTILEQLPFNKITTITHKFQEREVHSHVDVYPSMIFEQGEYQHIVDNEPAGYRILLNGNLDRLEIFNGVNWVVARMPKSPCCYLLNSTVAQHRVKDDPNRELIYIRGFLDKEKHCNLIEKSYSKYKDYAIESLL